MSKYTLLNPHIHGKFDTVFSGNSPLDAGTNAWNSMSEYFRGPLPKFAFTMERNTDKQLFHFLVKETRLENGKKISDWEIEEIQPNLTSSEIKDFNDKLNLKRQSDLQDDRNQTGGKHHHHHDDDDDDSSSTSESDIYHKYKLLKNKPALPIMYWWYYPSLYQTSLFIPTFVYPLIPFIEIEYSSAFFG